MLHGRAAFRESIVSAENSLQPPPASLKQTAFPITPKKSHESQLVRITWPHRRHRYHCRRRPLTNRA